MFGLFYLHLVLIVHRVHAFTAFIVIAPNSCLHEKISLGRFDTPLRDHIFLCTRVLVDLIDEQIQ